ncbi:MAG: hypothetical protein DMD55_19915 [Gemmatimonadetes bacterium]|nr:MAG: hypothetical protein DMD55_19915 [Gemmatimonadota bacterium]
MGSQVLNEPLPQLRGRLLIERCLLTELGAFAILSSSGSGGCLIHKPLSTSWILLLKLESLVGGNEEELIRRRELASPANGNDLECADDQKSGEDEQHLGQECVHIPLMEPCCLTDCA